MPPTSEIPHYETLDPLSFCVSAARIRETMEGLEVWMQLPPEKRRSPRLKSLPRGVCRLKLRPCVGGCGRKIKTRWPSKCRNCKRHIEVLDDDEYAVSI